MSWRDQLRKASFRGVEFFVDSADGTIGRRTVLHEYPLRDKPYVEDLGRRARSFTVEAYVLGADYMPARDALVAALEEAGPGRLVHPYLGEITVAVTEARLRESSAEGGMARFTLTCVESGDNTFPTATVATPAIVGSKADAAILVSEQDFGGVFSVAKVPEFVSGAAGELLGGALDSIEALAQSLPTVPGSLAELLPEIGAARGALGDLMRSPLALAQKLTGMIGGLQDIARSPLGFLTSGLSLNASPLAALRLLRGLFDFGDDEALVPRTTPSRIRQADNQAAVTQLVQRAAVIEAARASSRIDFDNYQDAVAVRTEIAERLDTLAAAAASDEVYLALTGLRAAVVTDITARGADLARVVNITPPATLPALVVAYDLYEDPARDAEIIARNRLPHPGFVPGGRAIEVLTDA